MAKHALPDSAARIAALADHDRTLLVEAGAGSGKTALMAGRVALLVAAGVHPKEIVAITFTEAAAAELLERIEGFVQSLGAGEMPVELKEGLPQGLTDEQKAALERGGAVLDEITCTTIHGFCQQLIRPYPVETELDPGARIIDPAAAELAYQDLMEAWLSARFGRDRGAEGLGRIPPVREAGGEEDFFAELLMKAPDATLDLIKKTAQFLKSHRTAGAVEEAFDPAVLAKLVESVEAFAAWYNDCGVPEPVTGQIVEELGWIADRVREAMAEQLTGRRLAELLFHDPPSACKKNERAFKQWRARTRWKTAAKAAGESVATGEQLSASGEVCYAACAKAYEMFCAGLGGLAFCRFVAEFDRLRDLYREYKRDAALLDFDDLLHHARDLLKDNEPVRAALAARYPHILVDEFQDTDPLQAEILWRIAGDGDPAEPWHDFAIRPGALFLVGDPKQAIYRFRGADVQTYLLAKRALSANPQAAVLEITANFRSQEPILRYVNEQFETILAEEEGQPGFTALAPIREAGHEPCVAAFGILLDDRHKNHKGKLLTDSVRREEASVVADMVQGLIGAYPVWDKRTREFRPARAGDIALLAPTGASLWIYERALERQEIPIATQAGKGFFRRQEVQDLIAIARAIADHRDTLAFGALIRGPLVGLTEEQIADEIVGLQSGEEERSRLYLWTEPERVENPALRDTLTVLQNLARKARRTTPYLLLAEAIDELNVRPILKARYPHGIERALANVDLALEMARAYAARGVADFARAMWQRWKDGDAQVEGRPDAASDAVSIITMHSAKGLEWPVLIPINSMTAPLSRMNFLYRRRDDSVHFGIFGYDSDDFQMVREEEKAELRRERIRLWYVALTRARDLLLLPRQTERLNKDWFSLIDIDIESLPALDTGQFEKSQFVAAAASRNGQDIATWRREAATIAGNQRVITWRRPSRHEELPEAVDEDEEVFVGAEAILEEMPRSEVEPHVRGSRERGSILHKLMEEALTGETEESTQALQTRAAELIGQLALEDAADPEDGPCSAEMAATVKRTLQLPAIVEMRPRLLPEFPVYAGAVENAAVCLTAGIVDAAAVDETGRIDAVIDWKSDVAPARELVEQYRNQLRDYLRATAAQRGLLVFLTSGRIEEVAAS